MRDDIKTSRTPVLEMRFINDELANTAANDSANINAVPSANASINDSSTELSDYEPRAKPTERSTSKSLRHHRLYTSQRFQKFGYLGGGYLSTRLARSRTKVGSRFQNGLDSAHKRSPIYPAKSTRRAKQRKFRVAAHLEKYYNCV